MRPEWDFRPLEKETKEVSWRKRQDEAVEEEDQQTGRVYSYTKVSPIILSQEDSPERRISWEEPLLPAQISIIFRYFSAKNIFTFFLHLTGRNKQPNSVSHEF